MRKCEICEWYSPVGKGLVMCGKKEVLFSYLECDTYKQDKIRKLWGR